MYKKVIGMFFVGIIAGLGARAFVVYTESKRVAETDLPIMASEPVTDPIELRCLGEKTRPFVEIIWNPQVSPAMKYLHRSVNDGPWESVFTDETQVPENYMYEDPNVEIGKKYSYKSIKDGTDMGEPISITISEETCIFE